MIPIPKNAAENGMSFRCDLDNKRLGYLEVTVEIAGEDERGTFPTASASLEANGVWRSCTDISPALAILGVILRWHEKEGYPFNVNSLELAKHLAPTITEKIRGYPKERLVLLIDSTSTAKSILARDILKED